MSSTQKTPQPYSRHVAHWHGWASKAGGGGARPPHKKISGGRPPEKWCYFSIFFLDTYENFDLFTIFKIKWPKSEEKLNFGGRCLGGFGQGIYVLLYVIYVLLYVIYVLLYVIICIVIICPYMSLNHSFWNILYQLRRGKWGKADHRGKVNHPP